MLHCWNFNLPKKGKFSPKKGIRKEGHIDVRSNWSGIRQQHLLYGTRHPSLHEFSFPAFRSYRRRCCHSTAIRSKTLSFLFHFECHFLFYGSSFTLTLSTDKILWLYNKGAVYKSPLQIIKYQIQNYFIWPKQKRLNSNFLCDVFPLFIFSGAPKWEENSNIWPPPLRSHSSNIKINIKKCVGERTEASKRVRTRV